MRLSKTIFVLFAAGSIAAPTPLRRRAVFSTKTYDELSISGGVAGDGKQEALDALAGLPDDLSTVEEADLDFLNSVNQICNDAEVDAFNPAIEAADGEEAAALEVSLNAVIPHANMHFRYNIPNDQAARKDQEQDPQAHCHRSQAPGTSCSGRRRCR
jgi:hypothetical protein